MAFLRDRSKHEKLVELEGAVVEMLRDTDLLKDKKNLKKFKRYTQLFVGMRCSELQEVNNKTNSYMASVVNRSESTWLGIIGGRRTATLVELALLGKCFDVGVDYFFKGFAQERMKEEKTEGLYLDNIVYTTIDKIKNRGMKYCSICSLMNMIMICIEVLYKKYMTEKWITPATKKSAGRGNRFY